MKSKTPFGATAFAGLMLAASLAQGATSIPLINAGFEDDDVPDNGTSAGPPTGWTFNPIVGAAPGSASVNFLADKEYLHTTPPGAANAGIAGAHTGDQYWGGFAVGAGSFSIIHQDTSLAWSSLSDGDILTVAAWATYRSDFSGSPTAAMWLNIADGSTINSVSRGPDQTNIGNNWFNVSSTSGNAAGDWTELVWNFEVTQADIDTAALNGWGNVNVGIGHGDGGSGSQVMFDDVSLTQIPEPSAALLGGLGALVLLRRRRD